MDYPDLLKKYLALVYERGGNIMSQADFVRMSKIEDELKFLRKWCQQLQTALDGMPALIAEGKHLPRGRPPKEVVADGTN